MVIASVIFIILKGVVAILSRIFTGPNVNFFSILGLCVMVLGGTVCFGAAPLRSKLTGRPADERGVLTFKLAGLLLALIGFIITVYVS